MKPSKVLVDTAALWRHIDEESIDARIVMVKEQIADNDSKLSNYLGTTRITPFARWSSYWQSNNKISNNGDVGVRFTFLSITRIHESARHWKRRRKSSEAAGTPT